MTQPSATVLDDIAHAVLTYAAELLRDNGYSQPERAYVAPGRVTTPPGCDALAVTVDRVYVGTPGNEIRQSPGCTQQTTAVLTVHLDRCVPGTLDETGYRDPAELDAAGSLLNEQAVVLFRGFQSVADAKGGPGRFVGFAGPLVIVRPEGTVGGVQLTLTVQMR